MGLKGKTVLDVGCGIGLYSSIFYSEGFKVKGIDISEKSIEIAKKIPLLIDFEVADLNNYHDDKYDIVFCWDVLHHTFDAEVGFKRLVDFVNLNGYLIISIFNNRLINERFARWLVKRFGDNIESKLKFVKKHKKLLLFLVYLWKYKQHLNMNDTTLIDLFCHEHAVYFSPNKVKGWYKEAGFKILNEDSFFQHIYIGKRI